MPQDNFKTYQEGLVKSLLVYPDLMPDVLRVVSPKDLEDDKFRALYESMIELDYRNETMSLAGILQEMKRNHQEVTISPEWVLSLDSGISNWVLQGPPLAWAELVKNESARHKLLAVLDEKRQILPDAPNTSEVLSVLSSEIEEISIAAADNMLKSPSESIDDYYKYLETLGTDGAESIPSPYPSVDYYTGGWKAGAFIAIGAKTGIGKTIFAVQSALAAIHAGKSTLYFSLEMTRNELITRLAGPKALVDIKKVEDNSLTKEEFARLKAACEEVRNLPIFIDDTPEQTIDYITSTAIKQSRSTSGLDLIIIDYLQLITPSSKTKRSRQEEVADISRKTKILAKKLKVPIIVLVQLKRAEGKETEERMPTLEDIRESGAVAQDSDIVILIHRNQADEGAVDPEATFIIDKNRKGPSGKFLSMSCMLQYGMFWDRRSEPLTLTATEEELAPVMRPPSSQDIQAALNELPALTEDFDPFECDEFDDEGY